MNDKSRLQEQIDNIISQLTLEEKVGMCHGAGLFRTEGVERLNISPLKMSDGPMGVRHEFPDNSWEPIGNSDDYVSYLPCNTALASTWNTNLAYSDGKVLGEEARGRGKDIILGPGVNIIRSPLCGRNFEYMSEDPYLIAKMAVPFIKGVQEDNDVSVCVKHFAVNNQETNRLEVEPIVDERALKEIYLPAFEAAVKEGNAHGVMTAYNILFGKFCSHNEHLIKDILRKEWGFDGLVISDWGAVHDTKEAAEAGLDIEMSVNYNFDEYNFANPLIKAVKEGKVSEKVIDEKIKNILTFMYKLNMFSENRKRGIYNSDEHREKLLDVARESIVLLKNDNNLLPLNDKKIKTIAVIGENANIMHSNSGGSAEIKALYEITPLLGIKMRLGGGTEVKYAQGYSDDESKKDKLMNEAVKLAQECDAVIYVGGLKHSSDYFILSDNSKSLTEGEVKCRIESEGFDRSDLTLPNDQDELIQELLEVNKNTIVVMMCGSPVDMTKWINDTHSLIQYGYNGMEGGRALAEVIFGDTNPSGKLSVTYPRKLEDCPAHKLGEFPGDEQVKYGESIFVGYRYFSTYGVEPLFPFGYGLSYTKFRYDSIEASLEEKDDDIKAVINVDVTNIGDRAGKEIVQIYVGKEDSNIDRPKIELKGFSKELINPGESKTLSFGLDRKAFSYYSVEDGKWIVEQGKYYINAGSNSQSLELRKEININKTYKF